MGLFTDPPENLVRVAREAEKYVLLELADDQTLKDGALKELIDALKEAHYLREVLK